MASYTEAEWAAIAGPNHAFLTVDEAAARCIAERVYGLIGSAIVRVRTEDRARECLRVWVNSTTPEQMITRKS